MRRRTFLQLCSVSILTAAGLSGLRRDDDGGRLMQPLGRPQLPGSRFVVMIAAELREESELRVYLESPNERRETARLPVVPGARCTVVTPPPAEGDEIGVHVIALELVHGGETLDRSRVGGYAIEAFRFSA